MVGPVSAGLDIRLRRTALTGRPAAASIAAVPRRPLAVAGVACLLGAALAASPAAAAPRLLEPPPDWVAPGASVALRVVPDATGPLRLERRVPGGWRVVAQRPARRGGVVNLVHRPRDVGMHDLRLVNTEEGASGTPEAGQVRRLRLRVRPLTLAAIGDVSPGSAAAAVRAHGPDWHWRNVGPWLRAQDVVVANWETADAPAGPPWPDKTFNFLAPRGAIAAAARTGGVDAASLANNHALDFGRPALLGSMRQMRAAGIAPFGAGATLDAALRPAIVERGGLRIALLGFNAIAPLEFWAGPSRAGNAPATRATIAAAVARARPQADLVIAYVHWGNELERRPNASQHALAQAALGAGADVVLGAHPHVLQPVTRQGRRLVAWSLGNFLFSPGSVAGTYTAALRLRLDADGVRTHQLVPVRIRDTRPVFTGRPPA